MRWLIWLVLPLAGCSVAEPACAVECTTVDIAGPESFEVAGVLVNQAIQPLHGGQITMMLGGSQAGNVSTGQGGEFAFHDVPAGDYRLRASATGYVGTETLVQVAGNITGLRLELNAVPVAVPRMETWRWDGHINCGLFAVGRLLVDDCPEPLVDQPQVTAVSYFSELIEVGRTPDWLQGELTWTDRQSFAHALRLQADWFPAGGEAVATNSTFGRAPVILEFNQDHLDWLDVGNATGTPHGLEWRVAPGGQYWNDVSLMVDQPITIFTSTFYDQLPPPGWTYVREGAP